MKNHGNDDQQNVNHDDVGEEEIYDAERTRMEVLDFVEKHEGKDRQGESVGAIEEMPTKKNKNNKNSNKKKGKKRTTKLPAGKNHDHPKAKKKSTSAVTPQDVSSDVVPKKKKKINKNSKNSSSTKAPEKTIVEEEHSTNFWSETSKDDFILSLVEGREQIEDEDKPRKEKLAAQSKDGSDEKTAKSSKKKMRKKSKQQQQRSSQIINSTALPTELSDQTSGKGTIVATEPEETVLGSPATNGNQSKKKKRVSSFQKPDSGSMSNEQHINVLLDNGGSKSVKKTKKSSTKRMSSLSSSSANVKPKRRSSSGLSSTRIPYKSRRTGSVNSDEGAVSQVDLERQRPHGVIPGIYAMGGRDDDDDDDDDDDEEEEEESPVSSDGNESSSDDGNDEESLPVALEAELVPDDVTTSRAFDPRTMVVLAESAKPDDGRNRTGGGGGMCGLSTKMSFCLIGVIVLLLMCGTAVGLAFAFTGGDNKGGEPNENSNNVANTDPNTSGPPIGNGTTDGGTTDTPSALTAMPNDQPTSAPTLKPTTTAPVGGTGGDETCICYQYYQNYNFFGSPARSMESTQIIAFENEIAELTTAFVPTPEQQGQNFQRRQRYVLRGKNESNQVREDGQNEHRHLLAEMYVTNESDDVEIKTSVTFLDQKSNPPGRDPPSLDIWYTVNYCVDYPRIIDPEEYVAQIHANLNVWMLVGDNNLWLKDHLVDSGALSSGYSLSVPTQSECP